MQSGAAADDANGDAMLLRAAADVERRSATRSARSPSKRRWRRSWPPGSRGDPLELDVDRRRPSSRSRARHDVLLVEGAGGLLVPVGESWTIADLAVWLGLPLVVVARAGLGTVNHTLLTVEAARPRGLHVAGVVLNGRSAETDRASTRTPS